MNQAADTYFCFTWNWVPVTRNSRCFADEAGIRSDYHTGTTWAPVGQTPVVEVTGRRFSFNMISAVSPRGEFRFMIHEGSSMDHPIHKSKLVEDYVASLNGQLTLFYLPPYAPSNSFVQLIVVSMSGAVLWRGEPTRGASSLL